VSLQNRINSQATRPRNRRWSGRRPVILYYISGLKRPKHANINPRRWEYIIFKQRGPYHAHYTRVKEHAIEKLQKIQKTFLTPILVGPAPGPCRPRLVEKFYKPPGAGNVVWLHREGLLKKLHIRLLSRKTAMRRSHDRKMGRGTCASRRSRSPFSSASLANRSPFSSASLANRSPFFRGRAAGSPLRGGGIPLRRGLAEELPLAFPSLPALRARRGQRGLSSRGRAWPARGGGMRLAHICGGDVPVAPGKQGGFKPTLHFG